MRDFNPKPDDSRIGPRTTFIVRGEEEVSRTTRRLLTSRSEAGDTTGATNRNMELRKRLLKPDLRLLRFFVIAGAGLTMTATFLIMGSHAWLLGFMACVNVVGLALLLECWLLLQHRSLDTGLLQTPFLLSHDRDVFGRFESLSRSLLRISQNSDPIYRKTALERLSLLVEQCSRMADGSIEFRGTETWRIVYEQLLRSSGLHSYRSVAWIRNEQYWQSGPGRQSLRLNSELQGSQRVAIERIVILADELWPTDHDLPADRVRQWIHEQHTDGIPVGLIRESALKNEPDLLLDVGIYGSRAVGYQELDETAQTAQFVLKFDFSEVARAEDRWKRLTVYSTSYQDFLDHLPLDE